MSKKQKLRMLNLRLKTLNSNQKFRQLKMKTDKTQNPQFLMLKLRLVKTLQL